MAERTAEVILAHLRDEQILGLLIHLEAINQSYEGQVAVAQVVMNRLKIGGWYGRTLREVMLKPYQFSCFNSSFLPSNEVIARIVNRWESPVNTIAALTLQRLLNEDTTDGATHYHAADIFFPVWARRGGFVETAHIGNHIFYR